MNMIKTNVHRFTTVALAVSVASCATIGKDYGTMIGCGAGTLLGAAAGYAIGGNAKGALIGAGAGAAVGCMAGKMWQDQQRELEKIAQQENLKLQMETLYSSGSDQSRSEKNEAGFVANVQSSEMFTTDSAELTPSGQRQIRLMAEVLSRNKKQSTAMQTAFMIIGHTDAVGTAEYNQKLSELRAHTVGKILAEAGIDPSNVYYQGAGASRPIGDNTTIEGQAKNRRVEIVEVANRDVLQQRIKTEESNVKYLAHGTRVNKQQKTSLASTSAKQPTEINKEQQRKFSGIDFGGDLASSNHWNPSAVMKPKTSSFQIISSVEANSLPARSCFEDVARVSGKVKNLATGAELLEYKTQDYLPGMNGRVWANLVNGNLVTLSPVKVLMENAQVTQDPSVQVVKDYEKGNRKASFNLKAVANTYEGEEAILYRVFINDLEAPLSCIDVVMNKNGGTSVDGKIYYKNINDIFMATFKPQKT